MSQWRESSIKMEIFWGRAVGGWKPGYQLVTHLNSNEAQSCWDIFLTNANESKARRLPKKIPIQDICILYIV